MRNIHLLICLAFGTGVVSCTSKTSEKEADINDMTTPLHLLQPEYKVPYGELTAAGVKADIDKVFGYIEKNTPVRVLDKDGKEVTDYENIAHGATLDRGAFRIGSYEWGVTYQALLDAADATGDTRYKDYVVRRFRFLAEVAPKFRELYEKYKDTDPQMEQILHPRALDDAGAMCCAMMKASVGEPELQLDSLIENYFHFIEKVQYRLPDGTFARHRPQHNTVWLDDMFMACRRLPIAVFTNRKKRKNTSMNPRKSACSLSGGCLYPKRISTVMVSWRGCISNLLTIGHVPTDGPS